MSSVHVNSERRRARWLRIALSKVPCVAFAVALTGCWDAPPDDAGDDAFAAEAARALEGRRPTTDAERAYFEDVVAQAGREALVDLLLDGEPFVDHWTQVFGDLLEVSRGDHAYDRDCFGEPSLDPAWYGALVEHVANGEPGDAFCPSPVPLADDGPVEGGTPPAVYASRMGPGEAAPAFTVEGVRGEVRAFPDDGWGSGGHLGNPVQSGRGVPVSAVLATVEGDADGQDGPVCFDWNMTDLTRAAIATDRLEVLYKANLFPMASFVRTNKGATQQRVGAQRFLRTYLNRDPSCMSCHSSTYSTTNALPRNAQFDRTWPVSTAYLPIDLEGSVFSLDYGNGHVEYGGHGGTKPLTRLQRVFRGDQRVNGGGIRPWGMTAACTTVTDGNVVVSTGYLAAPPPDGQLAGFAATGRRDDVGLFGIANQFGAGASPTTLVESHGIDMPGHWKWADHHDDCACPDGACQCMHHIDGDPVPPAIAPCVRCHDAFDLHGKSPDPLAPDFDDIMPTIAPIALRRIIAEGSPTGLMPAIGGHWDDDRLDATVAWLTAAYDTAPYLEVADRDAAFMGMLAVHIADGIVSEVLGSRLTLSHGQPRTTAAQQTLDQLATTLRTGGQWSLRAVLRRLILDESFGRRAPAESSSAQPDVLPMLANPWVATKPDANHPDPDTFVGNGQGDLVHQASAAMRLNGLARALEWPPPEVHTGRVAGTQVTRTWPEDLFMRDIGRYHDAEHPGVDRSTLPTLMAWEAAVGRCEKPARVFARDVRIRPGRNKAPDDLVGPGAWLDVIDRMLGVAPTFEAAVVALKLRLTGEDWIDPTERGLLADLANVHGVGLGDSLQDGIDEAEEEAALRRICGVLARSPQFLLVGLTPEVPQPTPASAAPACVGDICSQAAACARYDDRLAALGYGRICPPAPGPELPTTL